MNNIAAIKELEIRIRKCRQDCDSACKNIVNGQCSCIDTLSLKALKEVETKKKFYFLKDLADGSTDAVIIAKASTAEEIAEAIKKTKKKDNYEWDDIVDALPEDCEIYDKWSDVENIYY